MQGGLRENDASYSTVVFKQEHMCVSLCVSLCVCVCVCLTSLQTRASPK